VTDLLRAPIVGRLLRWPHTRRLLQLMLLVVAAAVVLHGLLGSPIAPRNLATVLTAIHWRGLLVLALLAVGNLFCTACPMILVRDAGRRVVMPTRRWPRWLRRKWIAIALLVAILFAYELFDVWELPRATAWLVLAYFGAALLIDLTFTGASFCKYVCPIGQFNFIASTMSPTELQVKDAAACGRCATDDCIKGRHAAGEPARLIRRGCELGLFLPMKVGNLDCTLCLDCVHACPHDNIALATRLPAAEWLNPAHRSGIGRLPTRIDLAALALVFTFAAPLTAFVMTAPAHAIGRWCLAFLDVQSEAPALALLFVSGLVVLPLVSVGGATWWMRRAIAAAGPLRRTVVPFIYALVPFGFGAWLGSVFPIQLGFVLLGTAGSIGLIRGIAERDHTAHAGRATRPWITLVVALTMLTLWILAQPMDMRGMSAAG